jgi:moderate conductance mechanosensitive channel
VSQKFFVSILFACVLSATPALAQNAPVPQPMAPASENANALTPDQAKRALDTLQDDGKRAQMIDTLRAIANASPVNAASAPPAAPSSAPAPNPAKSPIPLTADSLGAQLLVSVSEQFGEMSRESRTWRGR